jgi:hypothetical protein
MSQDNLGSEKSKTERGHNMTAWIGAAAVILAAVITGIFTLIPHGGGGTANPTPGPTDTSVSVTPRPVVAIPVPIVLHDPGSKGVRGIAFSFDGKYLATADANGRTYLWATPADTLAVTLSDPASQGALAVAFPPNDTMNATADGNGNTYL